ncbi:pyridoxal phosphate-dependent aminotransferase, partial [Patescibacteria group bacterium]
VPEELKAAAKKAIDENRNAYSPTMGIVELRKKIADKLKSENGIDASFEDVMLTLGVSGGLTLAFSACFDEGDEVIVADPYFVLYKQILDYLGVDIVFLNTYPDFHIDARKLEELVTPRTKGIILNSPNNPTGAVYSKEELEEVVAVARLHDILIISDEVYEKFDYQKKFFSVGSIYEKTLTLGGFSKSHFVTGWRVGFAHGPNEIIEAMNKLQQYTFVCAPTPFQYALTEEFDVSNEKEADEYKENGEFVYEKLKNKYELSIPEGAFYVFVKIPEDRPDFVQELLDEKLVVVPSEVFSRNKGYFRLSFAISKENLEKGVDILLKKC